MKNFGQRFKKYWLRYLITAIICAVVGVGIFLLMYFLKDRTINAAGDGCTLAFGVICLGGLLVLLTKLGAFDTFAFGFKQLGSSMFNREIANKYNNMADYKVEKNTKRSTSPDYWFPMVVVGLVFLVAAVIFLVAAKNIYE